jgi:2-polyprenyl-3-methyl-5-hydroxy-6-metoxy-1,4-benzoquinol methylase
MELSGTSLAEDPAVRLGAKLTPFPSTAIIVDKLLSVWPEHIDYCNARFLDFSESFERRMDDVSELVLKNVGADLELYCRDYRWMCEEFVREEIHFRRDGQYRLSTFEEAFGEVYSRPEYMQRYVRGILISQILWDPHARALDFFRTEFLSSLKKGAKYLEVGPGHGLFLFFASATPNIDQLEAWDVSESSIAETHSTLRRLGAGGAISIIEQDVLAAPSRHSEFDAAVISEVLEHLERPDLALRSLHAALKPGARIFINAPVNSPAPDHIYLWSSTDEFIQFVEAQGFEIEDAKYFPVTGATLANAVRKNMSISCVVIARKPTSA